MARPSLRPRRSSRSRPRPQRAAVLPPTAAALPGDPRFEVRRRSSRRGRGHLWGAPHPGPGPARTGDDPWTYVEATAPDFSETHRDAKRATHQLGGRLGELPTGTAAEVFLHRAPTPEEQVRIGDELVRLSREGGTEVRDLPGLCLLLLNHGPPGLIRLDDHGELRLRVSA